MIDSIINWSFFSVLIVFLVMLSIAFPEAIPIYIIVGLIGYNAMNKDN